MRSSSPSTKPRRSSASASGVPLPRASSARSRMRSVTAAGPPRRLPVSRRSVGDEHLADAVARQVAGLPGLGLAQRAGGLHLPTDRKVAHRLRSFDPEAAVGGLDPHPSPRPAIGAGRRSRTRARWPAARSAHGRRPGRSPRDDPCPRPGRRPRPRAQAARARTPERRGRRRGAWRRGRVRLPTRAPAPGRGPGPRRGPPVTAPAPAVAPPRTAKRHGTPGPPIYTGDATVAGPTAVAGRAGRPWSPGRCR